MPHDWDEVIRKDDPYEASDFRNAAYHLMTSQIIYENAHGHGPTYRLIDRYRNAFRDVFELMGLSLKFDTDYRFIAAIPTADKQPPMRLNDALLLLVLRKAYHEQFIRGNVDQGVAVLGIDELIQVYKEETGRDLPNEIGALKDFLSPMKACGAIRMTQSDGDSEQPFDIAILPGIVALVSEGTLMRLADYAATAPQQKREAENDETEQES